MDETFDVAIVGAGPAGISAACVLADRGVKTIVLERGEYPGAKNMFGGVLYGHALEQIIPDYVQRNCPIERNIVESRLSYLSRDAGLNFTYRDRIFFDQRRNNAFTVGRAKFDRWFADQAASKGALIVCATVVTDLLKDEAGRVIGVTTDRAEGDLLAKVVLLADGVNSPLALKTGFRPELRPENVALAVKELIAIPEEIIDERFGVSPGNGVTNEGCLSLHEPEFHIDRHRGQSRRLCPAKDPPLRDAGKPEDTPHDRSSHKRRETQRIPCSLAPRRRL